MSSKFGFILVKPQLGENIGACARAMKNFGFSKLHIVEPKINFPNHKAKATSVGAFDILNKAKVFNNIKDAILHLNSLEINIISLSEKGEKTIYDYNFKETNAIIMGSEEKGISKSVLSLSNEILKIPIDSKIDSLNVSSAFSIVSYEIIRQRNF